MSGKDPKVVLDSDEKDILAVLSVGKDVVVGTSPGAKVLQVGPASDGEVGPRLRRRRGPRARAGRRRPGRRGQRLQRPRPVVGPGADQEPQSHQPGRPAGRGHARRDVGRRRGAVVGRPCSSSPSVPSATWPAPPRRPGSRLHKDKQYFTGLLAGGKGSEVLVSASQQGQGLPRPRPPRSSPRSPTSTSARPPRCAASATARCWRPPATARAPTGSRSHLPERPGTGRRCSTPGSRRPSARCTCAARA